jgi:hypothetical protein
MSSSPHDALFKSVFSSPEDAAAELASLLPPALAQRLDWSSLTVVPGSFVDETLASTVSDLLYEVRCSGEPLWIHLLFEHQSTADPRMPFRLLRYMVRIWEQAGTEELVPIVPVVLHHSESGWTTPRTFDEVIGLQRFAGTGIEPFVPRFSFILDDVSRQSDEEIAARVPSLMVRLTLAALREARRAKDGQALVKRLGALLRDVVLADSPHEAFLLVLRYLLTVAGSSDPRSFFDALEREVGSHTKEQAMGLLDTMVETRRPEWEAKGRAEGKAEGKAEGRLEGQRRSLEKLLQLKFGSVSPQSIDRIAQLDIDALDAALERVLSADRVEDVLG